MNIYDYLVSPDIAAHCKMIGHVFTPLEMAVIVYQSHCSFDRKLEGYRCIIEETNDMPVPERPCAKEYKKEAVDMEPKSFEEMMKQVEANDRDYRAGKVPRQEVHRSYDADGNLIRRKAMVYYGESFEEAYAREASEKKTDVPTSQTESV